MSKTSRCVEGKRPQLNRAWRQGARARQELNMTGETAWHDCASMIILSKRRVHKNQNKRAKGIFSSISDKTSVNHKTLTINAESNNI